MANPSDFAEYVRSVFSLDALEKMTDDMDKDIEESQQLMNEIKCMFNSIPKQSSGTKESSLGHEDLSNLLEAEVPSLLMDDMVTGSGEDINLDELIAIMKNYAEDLKKKCAVVESKIATTSMEINNLDLNEYAFSLDQLGKRLANIKLSKPQECRRNPELEDKLTQLCQDVNNFTQIVQTKTKITECNKEWQDTVQDNTALQYNEVISKLLSGINDVTYLLQNRN